MIRKFYQTHRKTFERFNYLLLENPVLERGLTIAPVIVAATTVKNGLALSIAFAIITVCTITATYFIPKQVPYTLSVIANALVASVFFIPATMLVDRLFPGTVFQLGIYLPLLVTNSLIIQKSFSRFHQAPFGQMMVQLLSAAGGFFLVTMAVSVLREVLGAGTLFDKPLDITFTIPALTLPFGGFLVTGLLAAAVQALRLYLGSAERPRKKR